MHHTKIDLHIRKEPPNLLLTTTPNHHHHQLQIKIPSFPPPTLEFPSQYESFSKNQSTNKTHISTPHRRSIMSQSSNISPSSHPLKPKSSSIPVLLATRRITLKFIHHSCHPTWLKIHLKLLMLISLPFLYFFSSFFHIFCVVFLSVLLLISCSLALTRLPSFKLFLSRTSIKNHHHKHPVVWSIGSKAKSGKTERHTNSLSGVQVYSTGDVYEGEFHKGKCSGNGVYYYHMSGRYEGDWVNEKYDGYGVETWAKGSRYRGQYRQGLRQGVGVYRSFNGDFYSGEWCSGQCHGCGVYTCSDGSSYVGEFKWGVKHGLGHYHFRNGDMYAGEYFADKMHGFGVYTFGNGHRYEGAWHEGKRQGLGMYTFRNGDTQSGHWQNGILNVSTTQLTQPGSSPFSVDHLKVVNAVQEARQAAEKSFNVEKVDERVNRAVMAANKAATSARVAAVKAVQSRMYCNNVDVDTQIRVV